MCGRPRWWCSKGRANDETGNNNTVVGFLAALTAGAVSDIVAVGAEALKYTTTGSGNTAIGRSSIYTNQTGNYNTALGTRALLTANSNSNTAIGFQALRLCTGSSNTSLGDGSGETISTGGGNTMIGVFADLSTGTFNWSTALGENSAATATDQVRIGTDFTASIGGYQAWSNLSDGRYKKDVQESTHGLDLIMKLRPVTYMLDHEAIIDATYGPERAAERKAQIAERASKLTETGFIAQEVEAAAHELGMEFSGVDAPKNDKDMYALRYATFVVPLVKAVQEQQAMIEEQQAVNEEQAKRIDELMRRLDTLTSQNR